MTGIYGGTFDPIHLGHVHTVGELTTTLGLDQVLFIPSAIPPHRPQPEVSAAHRLNMVHIAVDADPRFQVDDRELTASAFLYD